MDSELAENLASGNTKITVIHHKRNMGIGYCFREGINNTKKKIVTWLPADGENDPSELIKYLMLLEHVDIVIPFALNVGIRSWLRRFLSATYLWIVNLSFGTMFNYTNGNVIYRREVFKSIQFDSNGFFFQTECLIKALRAGFIFAEVPVRLRQRRYGNSKALTAKSCCALVKEFITLFLAVHIFRVTGKVTQRQ